jgi:CheY-like chemotaxis protein
MTGSRILFVEDELIIRVLLADTLRDSGYVVVEASTGDEALSFLTAGELFDLLITDVNTPGTVNGLQLVELWNEIFPAEPVLISSAHIRADQIPSYAELISKPYPDSKLLRTVERLIGLSA